MRSFYIFCIVVLASPAFAEWTIDLSRRQKDLQRLDREALLSQEKQQTPIEQIFEREQPKEDIVIANTDKGFVPGTIRLKKDQTYQVTVVNVNKTKKNVSFMLDAFAEHHGTFFGDVVTFTVRPQKEGLFSYYCPEAEFTGKVLVYNPDESLDPVPPVQLRQPASDSEPGVPVGVIRGLDE